MNRLLASFAALALVAGCRGQQSEDPPIKIWHGMEWQAKFYKYVAQGESDFFPDGRAMRQPVEGTVATSDKRDDDGLREDDAVYRGRRGEAWVGKSPLPVTAATLSRGEERFGVYCSPCHDKSGSGHGIVVQRGYPLPPALYADHARGLVDGEIFDIITHGVRNMPAYATQIPVQDRWAIVAWLRVLQRSQHAATADVPAEMRGKIEPESTTP